MATGRKGSRHRAGTLGIREFAELPTSIKAEWSFLAIKADAEQVLGAVKAVCRPTRIWDNIVPESIGDMDMISPLPAILDVANTDWVVLLRSICYVDRALMHAVSEEARECSLRMQTEAVAMWLEDTSKSFGYECYRSGSLIEIAEWDSTGFTCWASRLRSQPKAAKVPLDFADQLLRERGLLVPACYPHVAPKRPRFIATTLASKEVTRGWILEIPEVQPPGFAEMLEIRQQKLREASGT